MFFAMAAMVALASCTKTELVDNSAPTPISWAVTFPGTFSSKSHLRFSFYPHQNETAKVLSVSPGSRMPWRGQEGLWFLLPHAGFQA